MPVAYECHVISLVREPQKYAAFLERNRATGLAFHNFPGIDGTKLTHEESVRLGYIRPNATHYTPGAIGCGVSHHALWKKADAEQKNVLIFEDDAYCRHDMKARLDGLLASLPDFDFLLLGYNTDAVFDVRIIDGCDLVGFFTNPYPAFEQLETFAKTTNPVTAVRLNNAFSLCAYVVSPRGARKLLPLLPMDNRPVYIPGNKERYGADRFHCMIIDMLTNTLYRQIDAYVAIPPLALAPNHPATSSTR